MALITMDVFFPMFFMLCPLSTPLVLVVSPLGVSFQPQMLAIPCDKIDGSNHPTSGEHIVIASYSHTGFIHVVSII